MKLKYFYCQRMTYKDSVYFSYRVFIYNQYVYSSMERSNCIEYILNFADKHGIEPFKLLKFKK